ncbi:MAG: YitT family protein [Treponemataceae bacterium]|nr:YitT family protein [Treponemataceae bacterium]
MHLIGRFIQVTLAAAIMALNLNTFVHAAGLLPGGFTGITLLLQEVFSTHLGITIPFSLFYWILNIIPAALCFKHVGKKFTLLSIWAIIATGLFTDLFTGLKVTNDILLCAVFGGLINGSQICLCLFAGATTGGTDFISILISEKTGKSAWNLIFALNCCVLFVFGLLFGWDRALYSIIFQFASTQVVNLLDMRMRKSTLLIISDKKDEIVELIKTSTNHDATLFKGVGGYHGAPREMIYSVVSKNQIEPLYRAIKKIDENAFVNVLETKLLKGRFFMKKRD